VGAAINAGVGAEVDANIVVCQGAFEDVEDTELIVAGSSVGDG
jgi:hypothetical protein